MFGKDKKIDSGVKKVDKIVTGIIIGGALAGLLGLSQTKKGKEITNTVYTKIGENLPSSTKITGTVGNVSKKSIGFFGKAVAFLVGMFNKNK